MKVLGDDTLRLSVFGTMSASLGERPLKIRSRKSRAALAYLALSESLEETRERLVGVLWSESEEEKARASLRQTLRDLRQVFADAGFAGLQTEKLSVELDKSCVQLDLWDVLRDAEENRCVHPLLLNNARIAETLLVGFDDLDPSFRVWLLAKRQTLSPPPLSKAAAPDFPTSRAQCARPAGANRRPVPR
jgi:DNA-binding SARP family transcriptional activator